jgi:hypothetical protein
MELKKITPALLGPRLRRGLATVSFHQSGRVVFSEGTVKRLGLSFLFGISGVDIFQGDRSSDFYVSHGSTYRLRRNGKGGAILKCAALSDLVIRDTWRIAPHIQSEVLPEKIVFVVCDNPVDDKENCCVFALLRKKI